MERRIDPEDKNREQIFLLNSENIPILIENFEKRVFVGFSVPQNLSSNKPSDEKVAYRRVERKETCYECINSAYQEMVKKCSAECTCDIVCSINLTCKAAFVAIAFAVCSDPGKSCSLLE